MSHLDCKEGETRLYIVSRINLISSITEDTAFIILNNIFQSFNNCACFYVLLK